MSDHEESEIIFIRKKHGEEEEGHHGGVWKLAFADFMTAMMAFFLVMWLINSTSKETKAAIVQYFNPVQLIDSNPAHKGLRDPAEAGQGKSQQSSTAPDQGAIASAPPGPAEKGSPQREAALLYDPMSTLDEIDRKSPQASSFGDPFDRSAHGVGYVEERVEDNGSPDKSISAEPVEAPRPKPAASTPRGSSKSSAPSQRAALAAPPSVDDKKGEAAAAGMRAAVEKVVKTEAAALRDMPHVEVTETQEGVLISLTDDANFSMFAVGSVEPRPQAVRIIGKIGQLLAKQSGEIELRGHTDGRSYKSAAYDNWRLSSDRANMAYYMLVRGGLPEKRVVKIAGYADRRPKTPKEPLAAVNRRIEILLRRSDR
ncbi:OmpA family protein [Methylosinus sporium]|uniref:OmpA family protein n=1 Tax=Methylosinus sporium TaxID=428 RepID=A0A549T2F7_METSR|nr:MULTISPECIES: flagellar motor protein MotB [Methylosinus]MBU3890015.1 OmpA family protein [Methylosinus sp. KRF6]TRL36058.1 OmpA family protein [Methylosinus sporium]